MVVKWSIFILTKLRYGRKMVNLFEFQYVNNFWGLGFWSLHVLRSVNEGGEIICNLVFACPV